jgi:hypothetical protein
MNSVFKSVPMITLSSQNKLIGIASKQEPEAKMKVLSDEFMPQQMHDRVPEADVKQNKLFTMEPYYEDLTTISRDDEMDENQSFIEEDGLPTSDEGKKGASSITGSFRRVAWLDCTLGSLPSSPVALRSIDDDTLETESITDDNSPATQYRDERQGAVSPCDFEVEIDDDGSHTQIEIKHSYDNSCGWSSTYEELAESFCKANDSSFTSISPVCPARYIFRENGNVIESLLEKNSFMCTGLDSWYNTSSEDYEQEPICQDVPVMPRNRSAFPAGRKKRIENLKINLTPFELDSAIFVKSSVNSKKYGPIEMEKRTRSFSQYKGAISPTSVANTTTTEHFSCYTLPICGQAYSKGSALIDWDENDEDDLCYDSDPNDLLVSSPMMAQARKQKYGEIGSRSAMYNSDRTVSELMGTKILLVWHRSMHYEASPIAVNAWIEHGSYIQAGLIQPKLMWQESCGKERKDGERFILNDIQFHSVDLLDISRVIPLGRVDRTEFPFAKSSCSFFIQVFEKELIFEAETTAERDNFIEGLKVLIARLGSKIIVGEKDVLEEFFTPASSEVPGTAPLIPSEGFFDMTASIC